MYITDSLSPKLEQKRRELSERRAILRARLTADPDPELREELEEIDRTLRAIERDEQ
jgi:hypothetical protein